MLYHYLKFFFINGLLLLSIWIIAQHWYDEPKPQTELQIIKIVPLSNGIKIYSSDSIVPVKLEVEQQAVPWLALTNTTPRHKQLNYSSQKNKSCHDGEIMNQYLVWYQYQGQQYQTVLNYQPNKDLANTLQRNVDRGYF